MTLISPVDSLLWIFAPFLLNVRVGNVRLFCKDHVGNNEADCYHLDKDYRFVLVIEPVACES